MSTKLSNLGMGWLPDYPDFRDNTVEHVKVSEKLLKLGQKDSIKKMLTTIGVEKKIGGDIQASVDLRQWF